MRSLPLFREMRNTHFGALMKAAFLHSFPPGVVLITEGAEPDFLHVVVGELATRYRVLVRELKNHKLRTGVERLANWILRLDREQGEPASFLIGYDKQTLASLLGMTPENLSRNLAALASRGVIIRQREIRVHNREALREFAKPDPLIDDR